MTGDEDWDDAADATPIEETPGYLGHSWDGQLIAGPLLEPLRAFPPYEYQDLIPEHIRPLRILLPSGAVDLAYEPDSDLAMLLEQLPSIEVMADHGPADQGPAGGSGYVFTMANGASEASVAAEVAALIAAVSADLARLKAADG
ncbi:hypothetical protein J5Y09_18285 [Roseomonas sp. PWR1]|uniref:Uncharacterized protein n=1 Tax=Roseomonas nitratireducens TaxID=2820810 RepID=A0ABS4AYQ7_9PROT|nr:hypothetical protein [Neoroseomonas nitratireducens]MBP0465881.1 hypothetical protein [Neoroseomonas nitratireducens]